MMYKSNLIFNCICNFENSVQNSITNLTVENFVAVITFLLVGFIIPSFIVFYISRRIEHKKFIREYMYHRRRAIKGLPPEFPGID